MDANELLASFGGETVKYVSGGKVTPILKLMDADNNYVQGILVDKKELKSKNLDDKGNVKMDTVITLRLITTNAEAIKKTGKEYGPTEVKAGDDVCLYGTPSRLTRAFQGIEIGTEVFIKYDGKKKEKSNGRSFNVHTFTVKTKKAEAATAGIPD